MPHVPKSTPKPPPLPKQTKPMGKNQDIKIPKKEFVKEHKRLIHVLESPSHKDDVQEAKKQRKELKEETQKKELAKAKIIDFKTKQTLADLGEPVMPKQPKGQLKGIQGGKKEGPKKVLAFLVNADNVENEILTPKAYKELTLQMSSGDFGAHQAKPLYSLDDEQKRKVLDYDPEINDFYYPSMDINKSEIEVSFYDNGDISLIAGPNVPQSVFDFAIESLEKKKKSFQFKAKHKSKKGGLTEAGRKAYNKATGSNLKRPQPGGGKRKKSFCARSKGQMKMHNISCSKTPDKRVCLARRRWACKSESDLYFESLAKGKLCPEGKSYAKQWSKKHGKRYPSAVANLQGAKKCRNIGKPVGPAKD